MGSIPTTGPASLGAAAKRTKQSLIRVPPWQCGLQPGLIRAAPLGNWLRAVHPCSLVSTAVHPL
eukprot:9837119-Heterocapsa_arctica.AAC.1